MFCNCLQIMSVEAFFSKIGLRNMCVAGECTSEVSNMALKEKRGPPLQPSLVSITIFSFKIR